MARRRGRNANGDEEEEDVHAQIRALQEQLAQLRERFPEEEEEEVAAPERPVLRKGGVDLDARTFVILEYEGEEEPVLRSTKILQRTKAQDPARLPRELFSENIGLGRRITLVQAACVAVTIKARRFRLGEGECLDLIQELWDEAGAFSASFRTRLQSAAELREVINFLNESLLTDRAVREFRRYADNLTKGNAETVSAFFERWKVAHEAIVGAVTEYQISRTFPTCFTERFRITHDGVLGDLEREVLHLQVTDAELAGDNVEMANLRNSITFEAIERFLEDPKNRARLVDVRDVPSEKRLTKVVPSEIRKTSTSPNIKPRPVSNPSASPQPQAPLKCYACGVSGHGVNTCPNAEKKKAYYDSKKNRPAKNKTQKVDQSAPPQPTVPLPTSEPTGSPRAQPPKPSPITTESVDRLETVARLLLREVEEHRSQIGKRQQCVLTKGAWHEISETFVDKEGCSAESSLHLGPYSTIPEEVFMLRNRGSEKDKLIEEHPSIDKEFKVVGLINGSYVVLLLDSGATVPTLTSKQAHSLGLREFTKVKSKLALSGLGATESVVPTEEVTAALQLGNIKQSVNWQIVPDGAKNYDIPIVPWFFITQLKLQVISETHVRIGDSDFYLGADSTYTPARMDLSSGSPWENLTEATEGVESLTDEFLQNTMAVQVVEPNSTHLGDVLSAEVAPLPDNSEFARVWDVDRQMKWISQLTLDLNIELPPEIVSELQQSSSSRVLCAEVLTKLRLSFVLTTIRPYPCLLQANGEKSSFDIEFEDGTEKSFRYIAGARNHSAAKRAAMLQAIEAQEQLGISYRLGPEVIPRVVLESVFT